MVLFTRGYQIRAPSMVQARRDSSSERVGEALLEPVEALPEPAGHLVVRPERRERLTQRLGPAMTELGQRLGQRHARAYGGRQVVDGLGPHFGELTLPPPTSAHDHRDRQV